VVQREAPATTADERLRVLRLVEAGTITADEAGALLDALPAAGGAAAPAAAHAAGARPLAPAAALRWPNGSATWLRLRVVDRLGRQRVDVQVPISLVGTALRVGSRWLPQLRFLDPDAVVAALPLRAGRRVFRVEDEVGGDRLELSLE
jgi:hypothetical protein